MLPQHLAVIGGVDDQPVVRVLPHLSQGVQDLPVIPVDRLDHPVVGGHRPLDLADGHVLSRGHLAHAQPGMGRHLLMQEGFHPVQVIRELLFIGAVRIMRLEKAHLEHERLMAAGTVVVRRDEILADVVQSSLGRAPVEIGVCASPRACLLNLLGVRPFAGTVVRLRVAGGSVLVPTGDM